MLKERIVKGTVEVALCAVCLCLLAVMGKWNYLVFHTLVELISVAVAVAAFAIAWNVRHRMENDFLLFIAMVYFASAGIDMIHTLAFKGMGVFPSATENLPTQLWIAGRYLQAPCLLVAPLWLKKKLPVTKTAVLLAILVAGEFVWIFHDLPWLPQFPVAYASHLTPFKIVSEYVISGIFLAATVFLWLQRKRLDREVFLEISGSYLLMTMSELAFTSYVNVYGPANMIGHLLRLAAVYLTYKALVRAGLSRPFDVLFHDLKRSKEELEHRVEERTAELQDRARQLARLASELTLAEQHERQRIAGLLHDHLQQLLVAASLHTEHIRTRSEGGERESLEIVRRTILEAIDASRSLAQELSPVVLRSEGMLEISRWLVKWMAERHRMEVVLEADEDIFLSRKDQRVLVYHSMRELLFNAVKHSGVSRTDMSLKRRNGFFVITISDNGNGFDPDEAEGRSRNGATGLGLFSIQERLALIGGKLEIDSAPGRGSRFSIIMPIE